MVQSPPSKRLDLQGIRGLAILSVLGFHFYPKYFPNGYLGVDQFFVLSGFLMCMLLTKTANSPVSSVFLNFYSRRFKRILPLYLLIILMSLVALYTVFIETAILQNQSSAFRALFFVSNRPKTGEEDYFEKLNLAVDIFTHTWSLSVEIQFYFVVPIIFLIGNLFPEIFKLGYYCILGITSLSYYLTSSQTVAFNSMFARIWQFLIGMVVYLIYFKKISNSISLPFEISKTAENLDDGKQKLLEEDGFDEESENEEEEQEKEVMTPPKVTTYLGPFSKYFFLFPMAYIVTYPIAFYPFLLRPIFTVFTGALMLISVDDIYLSNKMLTYIGDISYSLYLIHWPIYSYCKLMHPGNIYVLTAGLIVSILLAVVVFETFEKWYLKLSNISITILVLTLLSINLILIHKDVINAQINPSNSNFTRLDGVLPNMTYDDADRLNAHWQQTDLGGLNEPGCIKRTPGKVWCDYVEKGKDFKIAIFGNSLTLNHHKMFLQECRHRAYNVTMYSEYGCEPLAALSNEAHCKRHLIDFVDFLKSAKPDYAFLFTRFFATGVPFADANNTNLETDPTYKEMRHQMEQFIPNIKKKLYVLDAFPRTNNQYTLKVAKDLKSGRKLEEIHKEIVQLDTYKLARYRTESIVKECGSKCEMIDYEPLLFNKTTNRFEFFDSKGFLYFTGVNHLSAHGMELVRPLYTEICRKLT
ncbi:hypothetical protein B9Z55_014208 [Caenorhabditis nigoni]|uniref:Acyl_transf_3 domain-containing protein n=1 Tax=Caenorhabditis nigoni TaxID=1611254 RepID=A0A2G5U4Y5_9PELO|nr:hypothetical protein B9Z55_014208 [Caenorhabditis nigoni]